MNKDKTVDSYVKGVKYLGYSFYVYRGKHQAYMWGNTRLGYWRISDSPILHTAISNANLKKKETPTISVYLLLDYSMWVVRLISTLK